MMVQRSSQLVLLNQADLARLRLTRGLHWPARMRCHYDGEAIKRVNHLYLSLSFKRDCFSLIFCRKGVCVCVCVSLSLLSLCVCVGSKTSLPHCQNMNCMENYPSLAGESVVRGVIKTQTLVKMGMKEGKMIGSFVLMSACSFPPNLM